MLASRKPLAIALVLVVLFAMLAPAAMAAPAWTHGVDITSPTQAGPAYVNPPAGFKVKYDLTIVGTQVDDIEVRFRAVDGNNWHSLFATQYIVASNSLKTGVNAMTSPTFFPGWVDGWYDLEVCARDWNNLFAAPTSDWFCDVEPNALLIDRAAPGARLIKPAAGAVVSGLDYLMVGKAWDPAWAEDDPLLQYGAIKETWFAYCAITNWQPANGWCGPNDASWITIGAGTPTPGVPYQYEFKWNSSQVPDDHGAVRFCAQDLVGLTTCNAAPVFVVNRFTVNLRPGWNLVSTPLMLYDDDMDAVMFHLKNNVKSVWTAKNMNAGEPDVYQWWKWVPGDDMKFKHGQGYWINMKAAATLTFVGSFKTTGPAAPPEYPVFEGWNLIGYTHWGQPTSHWIGDKRVVDYLGVPLTPSVEALWRYDAVSETYVPMYFMDYMVKGFGYWLGLAQGGTINP